jgi:hypothetical protein
VRQPLAHRIHADNNSGSDNVVVGAALEEILTPKGATSRLACYGNAGARAHARTLAAASTRGCYCVRNRRGGAAPLSASCGTPEAKAGADGAFGRLRRLHK